MISVKIAAVIIIITMTFMACVEDKVDSQRESKMSQKTIEEVLKESNNKLLSIPGVVGTAQGLCDSKACIKVYVIKKTPELARQIPFSLDRYTVVIEETGKISALPGKRDKKNDSKK
jgi:hypothetical protein